MSEQLDLATLAGILTMDRATGAALDALAADCFGVIRFHGETDNRFRDRVSQSQTLDEDARFAAKVAAAVKDFDAEEEEAEL